MAHTASIDTEDFKQHTRQQWDSAAAGWNAHTPQIAAWLRTATDAMIDMAGVRTGSRVLDVAAGAGDQTLDIARRVGPAGHVLATDLSPQILALAAANARRAGCPNVRTLVADGEELDVAPGSFDAAVCRLGLMLFPDPLRGLRQMQRALRAGGGVCTMVFGRPERNPCVGIVMSTALRHAGLPARDPFQPGGLFSLGKPGAIDALFAGAGFNEIATTVIDAPFRLPSARDYLAFIRMSASPVRQILSGLDEAAANAAWAEMEQQLQAFATADGWAGPNELLLTAARR
ncbi:MAG TPA: class I SAM-dependent methyltransferase [Burkholderiaceae bacterium]|nr:class I SAM-dependent methyltransferase [Burkholderiaceae bacterium]